MSGAEGGVRSTTAEAGFGHTVDGTAYPAIGLTSAVREATLRFTAGMDSILATGRGRHTFGSFCLAAAPGAPGPDTTDRLTAATPTHAMRSRDPCNALPYTADERLADTRDPRPVLVHVKNSPPESTTATRDANHDQTTRL